MSTNKITKLSSNIISNEVVNSIVAESSESEEIDASVINNYQELNNKCDKVITKIKNRKLKVVK